MHHIAHAGYKVQGYASVQHDASKLMGQLVKPYKSARPRNQLDTDQ